MTTIYKLIDFGTTSTEYPVEVYGMPYGWTDKVPPIGSIYIWKDGDWVTDFTEEDANNIVPIMGADLCLAKKCIEHLDQGIDEGGLFIAYLQKITSPELVEKWFEEEVHRRVCDCDELYCHGDEE